MINLKRDIHSLTEFKRRTGVLVKQMKKTKVPLVLTVNGKAELVVQDAESYQQMLELLDRIETIEAIKRGLEQEKRGEGRPLEEVAAEFRRLYGLADE